MLDQLTSKIAIPSYDTMQRFGAVSGESIASYGAEPGGAWWEAGCLSLT